MQLQYHRSHSTELALGLIKEGNEDMMVYESILILNCLLLGGNWEIQQDILTTLKQNHNEVKFGLFNFLKASICRFKQSMQKSHEK